MNINKLRARKRAPTKMALQILSPEWVCPRLSLVNKLQYYGIWISGSLFFASLLLTDKRDTPLTLDNSNKAYCWRDTFLWQNKGTDEGILFWDSFPGRRLSTIHDINWRRETVVLIFLGGPLVTRCAHMAAGTILVSFYWVVLICHGEVGSLFRAHCRWPCVHSGSWSVAELCHASIVCVSLFCVFSVL